MTALIDCRIARLSASLQSCKICFSTYRVFWPGRGSGSVHGSNMSPVMNCIRGSRWWNSLDHHCSTQHQRSSHLLEEIHPTVVQCADQTLLLVPLFANPADDVELLECCSLFARCPTLALVVGRPCPSQNARHCTRLIHCISGPDRLIHDAWLHSNRCKKQHAGGVCLLQTLSPRVAWLPAGHAAPALLGPPALPAAWSAYSAAQPGTDRCHHRCQ